MRIVLHNHVTPRCCFGQVMRGVTRHGRKDSTFHNFTVNDATERAVRMAGSELSRYKVVEHVITQYVGKASCVLVVELCTQSFLVEQVRLIVGTIVAMHHGLLVVCGRFGLHVREHKSYNPPRLSHYIPNSYCDQVGYREIFGKLPSSSWSASAM